LQHTMDAGVLTFMVGVYLVTAVAFGLAPALYVSKTSANDVLKDAGRSGLVGVRARRWTTGLIVAELALTLVLLSGAGFMLRSFLYLYRVDVGFETSRLVTMALVLPPRKYADFQDRLAFLDRLDERLNAIGSIEGASTANYLPVGGGSIRRLAIEGRPDLDQGQPSIVTMMAVGTRYFDVLHVPVRRGRAFVTSDGQPGREAALINERLAALYFPGEDPIGKRIRLINEGAAPEAPKFYAATIVGVAPTIRQRSIQDVDPDPIVYITHRQDVLMGFAPWLVVRTKSDPAPTMALLRQEVAAMDPDIPLTNIRTMDENLARTRWSHRVFGTMFAVFAAIAMVLAAVGLYGVTAYSVAQRRQEIGIRMAIGAQPGQVWWLVLQRGVFQLTIGLIIGMAGALGVGRVLESQLVRTEPADPVTLAFVSAVLIVVAIAACFWPAHRATRLDPVKALRYE
jgi:predicted permease